jgi:hypothetical protein
VRQRARSLLWRVGQLLLIVLPVALLGLAGAMYLWQVKLAVEESLPPALRDYARRQAQLEVQVERVSLGWNRILLTYPEVRTLSGERLLRARYLEVRLPADGTPLTIELDRPEVWLQRNRQGMWNIDLLLRQPRPPEPTPFTFRVHARGGTLYFDDFLPDAPVRATLWADEFTLSQPRIGQAIMLRGFSDALGAVQARALSDGKRWLIEVDAAQAQGARFKPYLPRTEFDLAQATGRVSLQIVYAPDQPLQVQGTAQGVAQGATYRRKPLPWREATFALAFTESHIGGVVNTRDGGLRVQGVVDWSGRAVQVDAQVQVAGDDAAALWRLLRDDPPRVQGRYHAQLRVQGALDDLQAQGAVALARVRTAQGDLRNLRSPVAFAQGQLLLPALSTEYAGCTVQGKLWLDTRQDTPELRLYAQANRLPLQRVPALREAQLSGEADVSLLVYGRLDAPTVEANLQMDALRYANQRVGGLRARVQYADGALTIPLATLQGALGAVYLSGEVRDLTSDNPRFDLSVDASEVDLNLLAQLLGDANGTDKSLRLDGIGYLTAQLRGSLKSPEAVAEAVVFDGRVGDLGAEIAVVNLNLVERELRITQAQILRRAAQLVASGKVQLPETPDQPPRFQLAGDLYEFDLASVPDWLRRELPLTGLASVRFEAQGEPQAWQLHASLYAESLQYDQTVARDNTAQVIVQARDGAVQVDVVSAQARVGDGALLARGQWRSDGQFEAQWLLENAALDALAPYLPVEYRLTGRATVKGEASGTPRYTECARATARQPNRPQRRTAGRCGGGGQRSSDSPSHRNDVAPAVEDPLLKVPPVNGGGTERVRGLVPLAKRGKPQRARGSVPLAKRGKPCGARFSVPPREAGGTLRRGAVQDFSHTGQSGGNFAPPDFTLRTPDGEARLTLHECDLQCQQVRLTAETSALPIEWLQRVVRAVPNALPPAVAERIETLQGRVQASLSLEGALREPLAQLRLNAEQLEWRAQSLGRLSLQAEWVGLSSGDAPNADTDLTRAVETVRRLRTQRAALQQLRWQAETARLEAQARYTPERLTADLEVAQLPLRWARLWEPQPARSRRRVRPEPHRRRRARIARTDPQRNRQPTCLWRIHD